MRPCRDRRGVDLIFDALAFGRLWYGEPNAVGNAIGYAMHRSRSQQLGFGFYDDAGNVIETHEHAGERGDPAPTSVDVAPRLLAVNGRRLFGEELPDDASLVLLLDAREQLCPQLSVVSDLSYGSFSYISPRGSRSVSDVVPRHQLTSLAGHSMHVYKIRPRKDHCAVDLISNALPFDLACRTITDHSIMGTTAVHRVANGMIRVYDDGRNVTETHKRNGKFKEW